MTTAWTSKPIFALQPLPIDVYQTIYRRTGNGYVHIFEDVPRASAGSGLGLEVYRDDGTIAYSSEYKDLQIIDYIKMDLEGSSRVDFFSKDYGSTKIAVIPTVVPIGFGIRYGQPISTVFGIHFAITPMGVLKATMQIIGVIPNEEALQATTNWFKVEFLVIDTSSY